MRHEVKTFKFTCDHCSKVELVICTQNYSPLPQGWDYHQSHGWGMTDYSRSEELCSECLKKAKKDE